jgi:hypothetical protein
VQHALWNSYMKAMQKKEGLERVTGLHKTCVKKISRPIKVTSSRSRIKALCFLVFYFHSNGTRAGM